MSEFQLAPHPSPHTKAGWNFTLVPRSPWFMVAMGCLLLALVLRLVAAQTYPYMRLRDTTLDYPGPSANLTNLTEYKIGWFGPTNLNNPLAGDLWWTARLAVDQANSEVSKLVQHGSEFARLHFRLIPRWATNPWGTGVSLLARMVYEETPIALIGSIDSASTHLAEQVVAKAQLPLASPIATDKSVTLAGVPWAFACAPSDDAIARLLVNHILGAVQSQTLNVISPKTILPIVMLSCTDHESRMTAREVMRQFSARRRLPDFRLELPPGLPSYLEHIKPLQQTLGQSGHIVVLIVASSEDSACLLQAARQLLCRSTSEFYCTSSSSTNSSSKTTHGNGEMRCTVFGTHTMARARFLSLAGVHAEGVHVPIIFEPDPNNQVTSSFIEEFTKARGHSPDYAAALTYDATRLLISAIRLGGPNRARVRDALVKLSPWQGVTGTIQFDGTGQNTRTNLAMGIVRYGAILRLSQAEPR